jgi:hypothetical protein
MILGPERVTDQKRVKIKEKINLQVSFIIYTLLRSS